ncbi:hypothetical protein AWB70_07468 [Caballeronia cordobensis]|uniref:Uncharacterized protein n=1 Tax=Caballeronia cordobensis TaxID=1353886 RepID=A0A158JUF9_CABCO|nr:hypothetical protein AWB70_07468 [Caballeronia cordobensis]
MIHRRMRRLVERLRKARKRLLHIAAQLFGRQRRDRLRSKCEAVAVIVDGKRQRIIRALFRTDKLDALEGRVFIRGGLIVPIVQQRVEKRRGRRNAAASLSERERRMLMLQQRGQSFMREPHAVGNRCIGHIEANRQRVDQQPERLIDACLHAPEQHGAEHDASVRIDRAARAQHARPRKMTQARETHAEVPGLRAQPCVQRSGQRHMRFGDGRAVVMNIGEAEGQRRFGDIGEQIAEERFMRVLARAEPRLRDEIAERLWRAERVAAPVEYRADFRMHDFERRVIADQVMPVQLHEPAFAFVIVRNRDVQERRAREIETSRARIEMTRQMIDRGTLRRIGRDLVDRHGHIAQDHLSGRRHTFVNERGAQNVMARDDLP